MTSLSLRSSDVSHGVGSNTIQILHIFDGSKQCLKEEIDRCGVLIFSLFQENRTMINENAKEEEARGFVVFGN